MKKSSYRNLILALILTILCNVIGIAQSNGDPIRGEQLLSLARQAIGGEVRLNEIQGLGLEGKINSINQTQETTSKLKLMFMTRTLAGVPGGAEENINVDVRVGEPDADGKVMVFKGNLPEGQKIEGDKHVIVVRKQGNIGGETEDKVMVFKDKSGQVIPIPGDKTVIFKSENSNTSNSTTENGTVTKVEKDVIVNIIGNGSGNEVCNVPALDLGRSMLGLLLKSPLPLEISYIGDGENGSADALSVKDKTGFSGVLLLDKATHLPVALNYSSGGDAIFVRAKKGEKVNVEEVKKQHQSQQTSEISLRFSDHRLVDGVLLPHRISKAVNGEIKESYEIEKYDFNPTLKAMELRK
jgi:hypothetical protein